MRIRTGCRSFVLSFVPLFDVIMHFFCSVLVVSLKYAGQRSLFFACFAEIPVALVLLNFTVQVAVIRMALSVAPQIHSRGVVDKPRQNLECEEGENRDNRKRSNVERKMNFRRCLETRGVSLLLFTLRLIQMAIVVSFTRKCCRIQREIRCEIQREIRSEYIKNVGFEMCCRVIVVVVAEAFDSCFL